MYMRLALDLNTAIKSNNEVKVKKNIKKILA